MTLRTFFPAFLMAAVTVTWADADGTLKAGGHKVVYNAVIYTVDPDQPRVTAMAWAADGRLLALGTDDELRAAFPSASARDLEGRTVIPGLIDAHAHLYGLAQSLTQADLMGTAGKAEILEKLREQETGLGPGDWLLGRGWDQNDWLEKQLPTRDDLDRAFPERPVWLTRIDGHAGWANSAALERVERDLSGDWQPDAGFIHRDVDGIASGVLIDRAMELVQSMVPEPSHPVMAQAVREAIAVMTRHGLTGVHDAGVSRDTLALYLELIERDEFDTRAYVMVPGAGEHLEWLCARGPVVEPTGKLVARSVKLFEDGALGSRGAALLADYSDDPGNRGLLFQAAEPLREDIERVLRCGLQVAVHAIGDHGNRAVLDALEQALPRVPDNPGRHRIEHAQVLDEQDLARFGQLGIIAAVQPTHATSDMYWAGARLGPGRLHYAYAWRSLLDSGARLALGSDFPVEKVNPMLGLHAAVTRQDADGWPEGGWQPQERITREEALRGFTLDAAWAGFMESDVGSLSPGKYADFVVLDRDVMTVPEQEMTEVQVLETWLGGKPIFVKGTR